MLCWSLAVLRWVLRCWGEVLHIPVRPDVPTPCPAKLSASDGSAIKSLTAELRTLARAYGGCSEAATGVHWL